jgi:hypothetical protein
MHVLIAQTDHNSAAIGSRRTVVNGKLFDGLPNRRAADPERRSDFFFIEQLVL